MGEPSTNTHSQQLNTQPINQPNPQIMPRNGTQSDNVVDTSAGNQVHGVGEDSSIDRSNKAAPPPAEEKGEATEGMNASGGGNKITDSGKGHEITEDKTAK